MVLEIPELMRENQNWKIYRAHILDSAAAEGVVSYLAGAAPKPVDSRELEAWNSSNAVAKFIILEVITDSLLERLVHHELAHTLFSHLAAIFGDLEPIAIEPPAEQSDQDEPLCEDSHPKSDGAYSARTAAIVKGKHVERAGAAPRIAHDTDRDNDYTISLTSELETTNIHDRKPSGSTPTSIPIIPSTASTTTNYPEDPGDPPNMPDGMSRGDIQETAKSGVQRQRIVRKVNRNDGMASPAPNLADRTSEMTTGDGPTPSSRTRPKNTVKHQHKSTRHLPWPNGRANANMQRSDGHPKPIIHLPKRHRPPLEGERHVRATNGNAHSSSGHPMPQKLAASPNKARSGNGNKPADTSNKSEMLVIASIESEGPASSGVPRVRLGGESRHADDANGPRDQADVSKGQADELEGWTDELRAQSDAPNASNKAETVGISHGDSASTYLGAIDEKRGADVADGLASHTDTSSGHTDAPSVRMDALTATNAPEIVSTHSTEPKRPYSPAEAAKKRSDEPNACGNLTDRSSAHTDAPSVQTDALMPANAPETVSIRPLELKTPNSPPGSARERAEHPNGLRNHADTTSGPTDVQSVAHETETAANASKTVSTRPNIPKPPKSPSGDVKRDVDETDGLGGHADTSNGQADAPSVNMDAIRPANESKRIRMPPNGLKRQNSPIEAAKQHSDGPNGAGDRTDGLRECTDVPSAVNGTKTAANGTECVKTRQMESKTRNSLHTRENATPKYIY